jgi:hypothetical protein
MATRATEQEVLDIMLGVTKLTTNQVTPFLEAANRLVTDILGSSMGLTADQKTDIEKFIAAHEVTKARGEVKRKKLGKADVALTRLEGGLNLEETTFGRTALTMDTTGALASLGKQAAIIQVPDITA